MKNFLKILIFALIFPLTALAQNQGDAVPLGAGIAGKTMCAANEAQANTTSADGTINYISCDKKGNIYIHSILNAAPTAVPAEITPVPMATVLATAIPTAYPTPQFPAPAAPYKYVFCYNGTNQELWGAIDGSTTTTITIPPGQIWYRNLLQNGQKLSGALAFIHPSTLPNTGSLECGGD